MYGCSKNAPNAATLCHFSAAPVRPPGATAGSVSPCRAVRSDLVCGRPVDPLTEWHRCSGECQRAGGLMFTMRRGSPVSAAHSRWQAPAALEGAFPAGRCETGTRLPPHRAAGTVPEFRMRGERMSWPRPDVLKRHRRGSLAGFPPSRYNARPGGNASSILSGSLTVALRRRGACHARA
jgi:hypothetical protein